MGFIPETIRRELHGANIDLSGYESICSVGTDDYGVAAILSNHGLVRYAAAQWPTKIRDRLQGNSNTQAFVGTAAVLNAFQSKIDLLFVDNAELYRTASGRQDVAGAEWKENAMQVIRKQTLGGNGKQKCFYVAKDANRHLSQLSMGSAMFFNSFCDRSGISPARVQLSSECFQFLKYD